MSTLTGTYAYEYDALHRLTAVTDPENYETTFEYDPVGNLTTVNMPNGVESNYTYDALDRPVYIAHTGTDVNLSYSYTLDAAGNRTGVEEADGTRVEWAYDDAYRLLSESRFSPTDTLITQTAFTYDAVGNRLSQDIDGLVTSYTYNNLDQLLSSTTGSLTTAYTYDARGNLIEVDENSQITTYTWDAQDRLTGVMLPDATVIEYGYDADGRRVSQMTGTDTTHYLWDETSAYGDVVLETDENDIPLASYTLANGRLISQQTGINTDFFLTDGQGSTRVLTDSTGSITANYAYTAFGEIYEESGSGDTNYLYTGQQFDKLTGLYSLRVRYYSPVDGRFLSQDTYSYNFENPIELNRYEYIANNPINGYDPSGYAFAEFKKLVNSVVIKASAVASVAGERLVFYYNRALLIIYRAAPWLEKLTCLGAGLTTDADLPACEYIPDVSIPRLTVPQPIKRIFQSTPGEYSYDTVAVFRQFALGVKKRLPHLLTGVSPSRIEHANIGWGRYRAILPDGTTITRYLWAIAGEDESPHVKKLEQLLVNSGQAVASEDPSGKLTAIAARGYLRDIDSEYKILSAFLDDLEDVPDGTRIVVDLFSDRHPCPSCGGDDGLSGVIGQFADLVWDNPTKGRVVEINVAWAPD